MGLVRSADLANENSATQPIAVDGIVYFTTGLTLSIIGKSIDGAGTLAFAIADQAQA